MNTDLGNFPSFPGLERARPTFIASLGRDDPRSLATWSSRGLGRAIRDADSSWVRLIEIGSSTYYVKTYDYSSLRARSRGWFRNTAIAESRPEKEWRALRWLRMHGFPSVLPCAVFSLRQATGIRRTTLVTEAWPGTDLAQLLPTLSPAEQQSLLATVCIQITRMHALGFRDRNLDLRNLLAHKDASGAWRVAKIDSPRHKLVDADKQDDRLAQEDWQRFNASVATIGLKLRR